MEKIYMSICLVGLISWWILSTRMANNAFTTVPVCGWQNHTHRKQFEWLFRQDYVPAPFSGTEKMPAASIATTNRGNGLGTNFPTRVKDQPSKLDSAFPRALSLNHNYHMK